MAITTKTTCVESMNIALDEELERDASVIIIGEEVGVSGGIHGVTKGLLGKYRSNRIIDTPISEIGFTGLAIGACYLHLRPVVEFMTWNFSLQSIDHIINSCAKTLYMSGGRIKCPIVFRGPNGYNKGFAAQHTQDFSAYYASVPGLKVVAPFSAIDHYTLLKLAIRDDNPVIFLENEELYSHEFPNLQYKLSDNDGLGKGRIEIIGQDVTLIGVSNSVSMCLDAAETLVKQGIKCEVINLRSIRPLDTEMILKSVSKTRKCVIVCFSYPLYGISSEISAFIGENLMKTLDYPVKRICAHDIPSPYSSTLDTMCWPCVTDIVEIVLNWFE